MAGYRSDVALLRRGSVGRERREADRRHRRFHLILPRHRHRGVQPRSTRRRDSPPAERRAPSTGDRGDARPRMRRRADRDDPRDHAPRLDGLGRRCQPPGPGTHRVERPTPRPRQCARERPRGRSRRAPLRHHLVEPAGPHRQDGDAEPPRRVARPTGGERLRRTGRVQTPRIRLARRLASRPGPHRRAGRLAARLQTSQRCGSTAILRPEPRSTPASAEASAS